MSACGLGSRQIKSVRQLVDICANLITLRWSFHPPCPIDDSKDLTLRFLNQIKELISN